MKLAVCLLALVGAASATKIWNDFTKPFYDDFTQYSVGEFPNPLDWRLEMRDWGLVGKNHYPYLSDNDPSDRRCYQNNGVSPANVYFKTDTVQYPPVLNIPRKVNKVVMGLRAMGDNTPGNMGYPAGITKRFKIDSYKDTSSVNGRWLIEANDGRRVGSTVATNYYFGPGSFEVGMKPLQDFGATTTIWAYFYNEFYPDTPDPLQRFDTKSYHDPEFIVNCFIAPNDTATSPGANCSCPLNSFPPHPWQQQQMGEFDHWWASNSEIDIEFPTPANNTPAGLMKGMSNMMRFNTWKGQCGVQYTYSFQVVKVRDASGNIVPMPEGQGFHDGLYHVWRFDWYNQPDPSVGPTRVEFYIDGVLQRNVSHMNPTDPDPRLRESEWEFLNLMPDRPMRLWIGVWFSYWGTASPAACLTPDDTTDPFSRPCAPWGSASNPEDPSNPVWREALVDYVKVTSNPLWGSAAWLPEEYVSDGLALTEYPYSLPYANPSAGTLPPQSSTGYTDDFPNSFVDVSRWLVLRDNFSPRSQTIWGQMCHGNQCKGAPQDRKGTSVYQRNGGFHPLNVVPQAGSLVLNANGVLYNGALMGMNVIGGMRTDAHKVGAAIKTAQYYGPGSFTVRAALAGKEGMGLVHSLWLSADATWEETSPVYKDHCSGAASLPSDSDCKAACLNPNGWPKGTGYWYERNTIYMQVPYHVPEQSGPSGWSYANVNTGFGIGACESGTGLGSNGTAIPVGMPEFYSLIREGVIQGDPFTNSDGSQRFFDLTMEWHTWKNASCPRHITWSIDGHVIMETDCSLQTQALIPVTAMRLAVVLDFDDNAGNSYFETSSMTIDKVTITQFDEPSRRVIESFPYDGIAQPQEFMSGFGGPSRSDAKSGSSSLRSSRV